MAVSEFNPDDQLRVLPELTVVQADGTEIPIPVGQVILAAGANMQLNIDAESDEIEFVAAPGEGVEDPYFREKYEALANLPLTGTVTGGDGSPGHPMWEFSIASNWIAKFNFSEPVPEDGNIFVVNSECTSVGVFDQPTIGYPEAAAYQLTITDICAPTNNRLLYKRLGSYVARLEEAYDYMLDVIMAPVVAAPPAVPEDIEPIPYTALNYQVQTLRSQWNYLANRASAKLTVLGNGQAIAAAAYYRNVSDLTATGVTANLVIDLRRRTDSASPWAPWNGISSDKIEIRVPARDNLSGSQQSMDLVSEAVASSSITVDLSVADPMDPVDEAFGDVMILFKNMTLLDDGKEYSALSTLTLTNTHMGTVVRVTQMRFTPPI